MRWTRIIRTVERQIGQGDVNSAHSSVYASVEQGWGLHAFAAFDINSHTESNLGPFL